MPSDERCLMTNAESPGTTDAAVRAVAALLPFAVELDADMGYTGDLFIDLGRRGGPNDPPDTAGIDAEVQPTVWTFDIEGGRETIESTLGLDAEPAEVARWISEHAHRAGSPAALAPTVTPDEI
jgi:hypothetical protein